MSYNICTSMLRRPLINTNHNEISIIVKGCIEVPKEYCSKPILVYIRVWNRVKAYLAEALVLGILLVSVAAGVDFDDCFFELELNRFQVLPKFRAISSINSNFLHAICIR